jgi:hypothetical protein
VNAPDEQEPPDLVPGSFKVIVLLLAAFWAIIIGCAVLLYHAFGD